MSNAYFRMGDVTMDKLVSLAKQRGFIFPGSEIYGGLANTWDYGPLGVELKNNVKRAWWKCFVQDREDVVGIESAILMNPKVWEASGHLKVFHDPLIDCKNCNERFRGDHLLEKKLKKSVSGKTLDEINQLIQHERINCPKCGAFDWTLARQFNLMFKTHQGVTEDSSTEIYLRPETAQGMFVNFKNVLNSTRKKLPFGIGQIGKSFRNEITPGNFTYRTREFEQMEMEYFVKPGTEKEHFDHWVDAFETWFHDLGISKKKLRRRAHDEKELSHYSNMTVDLEYEFPFGWGELMGIASRTDYDLKQHMEHSGQDLTYFDSDTQEKYIPYVVEPALGVDRTVLILLLDAYTEEEVKGETRTVLKLNKQLAPTKIAVFPLKRNEEKIVSKAHAIIDALKAHWTVQYDDTGSIGKLYRRQDEVGTPYCITVDFDSLENDTVTVRDRDTMEQERVEVKKLVAFFGERLNV